ncbi:class I SAM-dependent methyltransferase [Salinispira pacifica]
MKKRKRHLWKWARRNDISCFRVYNRDIPEIPLVVDYYDGYLHVAEYERPSPHTAEEHDEWRDSMIDCCARALTVSEDRLFFKYREKQSGHRQYGKVDRQHVTLDVREGGLLFRVNLSDYIDTGLFLDHRITRSLVRDAAMECRVLNLYSYTGSFAVYAAAGGARTTTSVDLSNSYTQWAGENMQINGFVGPDHRLITADVGEYLSAAARRGEQFDLIILDPPTFSNSKKMTGVLDIQRDHPDLINRCLRLLAPDGMLFFSSNFKRLKFSQESIHAGQVSEITGTTVPEDFSGKRPHRTWLIGGPKEDHGGRKGASKR